MNNKDIEIDIINIVQKHCGLKYETIFSRLSWKSFYYIWMTKLDFYDLLSEMINSGKLDCIEYTINNKQCYLVIPRKTTVRISCQ